MHQLIIWIVSYKNLYLALEQFKKDYASYGRDQR